MLREYDSNVPITSMKDAFVVTGKNVVVTGGSRGIGYGIVKAFAELGNDVAIICRGIERGNEAAKAIADEYGVTCFAVQCDISSLDEVKAAADVIYGNFEHVDILINNAGVGAGTALIDDENLEEWYRVIGINLNGPANMMHVFGRKMVDAGRGGVIINTSSAASFTTKKAIEFPMPAYHAAKAGLNMLTQYMAAELGEAGGIRVNSFAPGLTRTELNEELPEGYAENMLAKENLTHRMAEPIELGAFCVFLASPAGSQIDGVVFKHDGGQLVLG